MPTDRLAESDDQSQSRVARWTASIVSKVAVDVTPHVEAQEALPDEERPECPYCERSLGVAPGHGGLAWKCIQHGTFPASEFEPNILRAMQADVEDGGGPTIFDALMVLPLALFIGFLSFLKRVMRA